mgnify:CR=1 FL=1
MNISNYPITFSDESKSILEKCSRKYSDGFRFSKEKFEKLKNLELIQYVEKYQIEPKMLYYIYKNHLMFVPQCRTCGKILKSIYHNRQYCSPECAGKSDEVQKKRKNTCLEKYGCEVAFQNKEIQDKQKKTCLEKYGCENVFQSEKIREKIKKTNIEKYGVDNPAKSEKIKTAVKQTNLEKYGVEYYSKTGNFKKRVAETNIEKYGIDSYVKTSEYKEKIKNTCLKKYGTEHYFKTDDFKKKIKTIFLEKYGVESYFQTEEYKSKSKQTFLEKYGVENPFSSDEIKENIKQTNLEKYGVEYCSQSKEIRNKIRKNNLQKYDVDWYSKTDEYKDKVKNTCIERYGVDNYAKTDDFKEQINKKFKERYFEINKKNLVNKNIEILMDKNEYVSSKLIKYQCIICNSIFESDRLNSQVVHCPYCLKQQYSSKEKEVLDWIKTIYSGEIIENDRTILNGKELDIYIPEKKLAIEFNGDYWNNEEKVGKYYHQEKSLACREQNIRLIHIFEHEWINKQDICKSIIKSALGLYNKTIYARKCTVKEISSSNYRDFLNNNHLQGSVNSSIRLSLYYQDELVSVIGFGKSRFKQGEMELHRFCCKLNYHIPGAFSKLIKHSNLTDFITYVDLAHFTGDGYKESGFNEISVTEPNYKWVKGYEVLNRFVTQKHKLVKFLGENYNPEYTEEQNMLDNRYIKVYDSGNIKMEYKEV